MTRLHKAIAAGAGLVIAALTMSGCAAVQQLLANAPVALPTALPTGLPTALPTALPTILPTPDVYEKIYQGGSRPDGLTDDEWAKKSKRHIAAAGALHKIFVYDVDATPGSDALTISIKGNPDDAQLLADIEEYVIPVALKWSPSVTVRIDPSLCGVIAGVRDESPVCDLLTK